MAFCQNDTIEDFYRKTEEGIRKGGFDDSEVLLYMNYLKNYPDSALAYGYYLRGILSEKKGNHQDCIDDATKALKNGLRNPEQAYLLKGNCLYAFNKIDSAIIDYSDAIKINPDFADAYYQRGLVFYDLERYEESFKDLEKSVQLDSSYASKANTFIESEKKMLNPITTENYNYKGYNYLLELKFEKAIKTLSEAIEKKLYDDATYTLRGLAYFQIAQNNEAIADYNKAIELNKKDGGIYCYRGNVYYALKKYDVAINDYNKAIKLKHHYVDAYLLRGLCYIELKQYKKAIKNYNKLLKFEPDNAEVYFQRGEAKKLKREKAGSKKN